MTMTELDEAVRSADRTLDSVPAHFIATLPAMDIPKGHYSARRFGPRPEMLVEYLHAGSDHLLCPVQQLHEHCILLPDDEPNVD